jgi:biofilm PGA synthesis N-glycosyltransferase PgaC
MVVAPDHHRRHRRQLADSGGGLAGRLRAERDRLDPDAGDLEGLVEAAAAVFSFTIGVLWWLGFAPSSALRGFQQVPEWWGLTLTLTYLGQALVSHLLERRYEPHMLRTLFWMIWYPLAFWIIGTLTTVVGVPRALLRPRQERTTWVSPDRGLR